MLFQEPKVEFCKIELSDVILTSGDTSGTTGCIGVTTGPYDDQQECDVPNGEYMV